MTTRLPLMLEMLESRRFLAANTGIDTTPPGPPSITSVGDNYGAIKGSISPNRATDDTTPSISGRAEANTTVEVFDGGVTLGQTKANATGRWSFTTQPLGNGSRTFTARAIDRSGNVGAFSSAYTIAIDTQVPSAAFEALVASRNTAVGSVAITFTEAVRGVTLAAFSLTRDGRPVALSSRSNSAILVGGEKSYTLSNITSFTTAPGSYVLSLQNRAISDNVGNRMATGAATTWVCDTSPPAAPRISSVVDDVGPVTGSISPNGSTDDTALTLGGSAEANSTVEIFDGHIRLGRTITSPGGQWSFTAAGLSDGAHAFAALAVDPAGNIGPLSAAYPATLDTTPSVPSVTEVPASGTYTAGDTLSFTVTFSEPVTVIAGVNAAVPTFDVTIGGITRQALYVSGSGTAALTFQYRIVSGDNTAAGAGISIGSSLAFPPGAAMRDLAGNAAIPSFLSVASASGVRVDTAPPVPAITGAPVPKTYKSGDTLSFTVTFSEPVTVTAGASAAVPMFDVTIGGITRQALYVSGSGTAALTFQYRIVSGDNTATGAGILLGSSLAFPAGASIKDTFSNSATAVFTSVVSTSSIFVDSLPPTAAFGSLPGLRRSPVATVHLTASEAVSGVSLESFELSRDGKPVPIDPTFSADMVYQQGASVTLTRLSDYTKAAGIYTLTLRPVSVTDDAGNALSTSPSTTWEVLGVPDSPTNVFVYAGDATATITWSPSKSGVNCPLTDYVIEYSNDNGVTWRTYSRNASTATTAVVTGLSNGTSYVFRVSGVNVEGAGAPSDTTCAVMPLATRPTSEFTYRLSSDNTVTITGYTGQAAAVGIPSTIGGAPVTLIQSYAFARNTTIAAVTIPATVREIRHGAFQGCTALRTISIADGVLQISTSAFAGTLIESLSLPRSISVFEGSGVFVFSNGGVVQTCRSLKTICVDADNASYVSKDGVLYAKALDTLVAFPTGRTGDFVVPNTVRTSISFMGASLTSITLPAELMNIPEAAFYACESLQSVRIGNQIQTIGSRAFEGCRVLQRLILPASLTGIGYLAFNGCAGLKSLYFFGAVPTVSSGFGGTAAFTAYCRASASGWGSTLSGYPVATFTAVTPDAPVLTGGEINGDKVQLSWQAPYSSGGAAITEFVVQSRQNFAVGESYGDWTDVLAVDGSRTSANIDGLTPGVTYQFRVVAANSVGRGVSSMAREIAVALSYSLPLPPSELFVNAADGSATVSWDSSIDYDPTGAVNFNVEVATTDEFKRVATYATPGTSQLITGLENGLRYSVRVAASGLLGTGVTSNYAYVVPTGSSAPARGISESLDLYAYATSSSTVSLQWNPVANADSYEVWRKYGNPLADTLDPPVLLGRVDRNTTSFTANNLTANFYHSFYVYAKRADTVLTYGKDGTYTYVGSYSPPQYPAAERTYLPARGPLFEAKAGPPKYGVDKDGDGRYPTYDDVVQGAVGSCWLLASLAAVAAKDPRHIENIVVYAGPWKVNGYSVDLYRVQVFDMEGVPRDIIVDNMLPAGGKYYARVTNGAIWPAILEKAYIQANALGYVQVAPGNSRLNSYKAIDGGWPHYALNAFGFMPPYKTNPYVRESDLLQQVSTWYGNGAISIATGTNPGHAALWPLHAYAVVDYVPGVAQPWLVYNPHGATSSGASLSNSTKWGLFSASGSFLASHFSYETEEISAAVEGSTESTWPSGAVVLWTSVTDAADTLANSLHACIATKCTVVMSRDTAMTQQLKSASNAASHLVLLARPTPMNVGVGRTRSKSKAAVGVRDGAFMCEVTAIMAPSLVGSRPLGQSRVALCGVYWSDSDEGSGRPRFL